MPDLVLREATTADAATLVALIHAAFEEYRGQLDPPSGAHQEAEEQLRRKLAGAHAVLALLDGQARGCVFYEREAGALALGRLAVPPAYRRQGIGQALIAYVEEQARLAQVGRVRLGVRLALPSLRAYYERRGYRPAEYCAHAGYAEPTYVILEKDVRPGSGHEGT